MRDVSVVIPVYRGAESLPLLIPRLVETLSGRYDFEIICIHDCGPDDSLAVLKDLAGRFAQLKVVALARNFGQENAILAGFRYVRCETIVCMDEDLQHDPADVPRLVEALWERDLDVVFAAFTERTRGLSRLLGTWLNDYMMRKTIHKPKGLALSSFVALRRFVTESVREYNGPYPYLAGSYLAYSRAIGNIDAMEHERPFGESSYDFRRLVGVWVNGLVNFSIFPLRLLFFVGMGILLLSLMMTVVLVINRLTDPNLPVGWTLVMITILAVTGVQSVALGLLGEYIGRLLMIGTRKPAFAVREVFGADQPAAR